MLKTLSKKFYYKVLFFLKVDVFINDLLDWKEGFYIFSRKRHEEKIKINLINTPNSIWILFSNKNTLVKLLSKISTKVILINNKSKYRKKDFTNKDEVSSDKELYNKLNELDCYKFDIFLYSENLNLLKNFIGISKTKHAICHIEKNLKVYNNSNTVLIFNKKDSDYIKKTLKQKDRNFIFI